MNSNQAQEGSLIQNTTRTQVHCSTAKQNKTCTEKAVFGNDTTMQLIVKLKKVHAYSISTNTTSKMWLIFCLWSILGLALTTKIQRTTKVFTVCFCFFVFFLYRAASVMLKECERVWPVVCVPQEKKETKLREDSLNQNQKHFLWWLFTTLFVEVKHLFALCFQSEEIDLSYRYPLKKLNQTSKRNTFFVFLEKLQ